jgi:ribonuclease BN (tRNA processing enzyme)
LRLTFLGVRGSTPAPGAEFVGVGGNTSCLAVAHDEGPPSLVLDAGTGIRRLTALLAGEPFRGTILLTHLHWDHVQGLPFFGAGDRDDAEVVLAIPDQGEGAPAAADVLGRALSPPHFPIDPSGLRGSWHFESLQPGCGRREGFEVTALEVAHKGGVTYGYRVSDGEATFAYLPDHATVGPPGARLAGNARRLLEGADVLVHDAQFVAGEETVAADYGHALVDDAVHLARVAGVGQLWLFHHGPDRTDDAIARIAGAAASDVVDVRVATEQTVLQL